MHCQLRSADRTLYDGDASLVVAQSPRGEFAIMNGHAPLLAALAGGTIRIQETEQEHVFVSRGGTLRVTSEGATLLVESAQSIDEIDPAALQSELDSLEASNDGTGREATYIRALLAAKEQHG